MHFNTLLFLSSTSILTQAHPSPSTETSNTLNLPVNPVITNSTNQNTDCTRRPVLGHGPVAIPDTPEAFYNSRILADTAFFAATPFNWTRTFVNQRASIKSTHYLGFAELTKYSTHDCAAKCDKIPSCDAMNIYFERTPSVNLARKCPNAPSTTVIKCAFWGDKVRAQDATNWGSKDWSFDVVMAGSNGYNRRSDVKGSKNGGSSRFVPNGTVGLGVLVTSLAWM